MISAGIVGLGVGERHIDGYETHPDCRVTALADFCAEKRADVLTRYPDRTMHGNASAVLDNPDIDVVSIATWDNFHFEQVRQALLNDKHVFVEKPLVLRADHAREIRQILRDRPHLKISSNLILRRCPRFLWLREQIRSGRFGTLFHLDTSYQYGRIHKLLSGWRGEVDDYSLVLGGAVHLIDLVMWLTGKRPVRVQAMGNRIATADSAFRNFDLVRANLMFDDGMIASIGCNGGCVHPHYHKLEVYGTDATFVNGLERAFVYRVRNPETPPEVVDAAYPGVDKGDLLADFVDAIIEDREPEVSVEDVFDAISVCFAIEHAAHSGQPVDIEYI